MESGHPTKRDKPLPVKLFCALIGREEALAGAAHLLEQEFGEIDLESRMLPFDFTSYYRDEMGEGLVRKWVAFRDLKERAYLPWAKRRAERLERRLSTGGQRTLNLDPGYVDNAQVVLATSKNYAHRIYIGMGYYAEVTLLYVDKGFRSLDWTYPDYRSEEAIEFFSKARSAYHQQAVRT